MNIKNMQEIVEGIDYFYHPREKGWKSNLLPMVKDDITNCMETLVIPPRAANHVKALVGRNVEIGEKNTYLPIQEYVNDVVKKCPNIAQGIIRQVLYGLVDYQIIEDGICDNLSYLNRYIDEQRPFSPLRREIRSHEIEYFLSKFNELYRKREVINIIEKTYANTPTNTVAVYPLFTFTELMTTIEAMLKSDDETDIILFDGMVKSLLCENTTKLTKAYATLCVSYLKALIRENHGEFDANLMEVFYQACEKHNDGKPVTAMLSPIGESAKEFESIKVQNDIQIVNILSEALGNDFLIHVNENHTIPDSLIGDVQLLMEGADLKQCIKRYGNLTCEIEPSDVFKLSHSKRINNLCSMKCDNDTEAHFNVNHLNLELVCKDLDTSDIILFSLMENGQTNETALQMFKTSNEKEDRCQSLSITRLKFKSPDELTYKEESSNLILEGLKISEDGGIKFTYTPKKSYMDEYAQAHKIIHENFKAGNFEAMKTDLAFLFAFINHIESQVLYSKSASTSKKEDAKKARMFAINDFKTYLKKVQENEPGFDFLRYYETIDKSKVLVEFTNSEIIGIRKLLRTILM